MQEHIPSILIVDDSSTTRAMIRRVLDMAGLSCGVPLEAGDGLAALQLMRSQPVDLVLADLTMPVMGGAEMIEQMRREPSLGGIPVVVISAQPDEEQIERLRRSGVVAYLAKPFTPEGIRGLVRPLLKTQPKLVPTEAVQPSGMYMTLAEAFGDALQTMAFITPELSDHHRIEGTHLRVVRVQFQGNGISGSLALAAPAQFGAVVAGNCGTGDSLSDAEDALKELANVTCGLVLRYREGGAKGFELSPPTIHAEEEVGDLFGTGDSVVLSAEGYLVAAQISADEPLFKSEGSSR